MKTNLSLFERAQRHIPGGVNSPVRAFRAVGGTPPFFERASGAHLWDVEGRRYIDYVGSWGPMILGHAEPAVTALNGLSSTRDRIHLLKFPSCIHARIGPSLRPRRQPIQRA